MSPARDHELLCEAVREAGQLAQNYFEQGVEHWDKAPGDPVSEADHAVDALLQERLLGARPDYGWLSEETEDDESRLSKERVWVVDPIDGTRAFIKGRPEFTVCVGLVQAGRPIAAAVFNPASKQMFEATAGGGARLNGRAIAPGRKSDLVDARLLTGDWMFSRAGVKRPKGLTVTAINSIAYRICLVACGQYDGVVSLNGKSDWDLAAADLIANEAGARMTGSRGEGFTYDRENVRHHSLIVAGPAMHGALLDLVGQIDRPAGSMW
jgi:myo-inositol-1(or 4)-monophosphatase